MGEACFDVKGILSAFTLRCEAARNAGGIAHEEVVEAGAAEPDGYWLDPSTDYWIPNTVTIFPQRDNKGDR